jgi:hypothetical protein
MRRGHLVFPSLWIFEKKTIKIEEEGSVVNMNTKS